MRRRRFILTAVTTGSIGLAGCTENTSETEDQPTNDQSSNGDPDSEAPDYDSQSSDDESSQDETRDQRLEEIYTHYNSASGDLNDGVRSVSEGIDEYNSESYNQALSSFSNAQPRFTEAETGFEEALSVAIEVEHKEAQSACDEVIEYATLYFQAAQVSESMAEAALDEDFERASELTDEANRLRREANRLNPPSPADLRNILGI